MEFRPPKKLNMEGDLLGNWNKFRQAFDIFVMASGKSQESSEIKAAMLLNLIGEDALDLFNTFSLSKEDQKDEKKIIDAFEDYIKPRKNVIYDRYLFYSRNQVEGETFESFVKDIKRLAESCEFGSEKENMIRDRVVIGIRNRENQERLLRMPQLTLNKAIDVCRAGEISKSQVKVLHSESSTDSISRNNRNMPLNANRSDRPSQEHIRNKVTATQFNNNEQFKCNKCNLRHCARKCPAYGKKCNICGKMNHYVVSCKSKGGNSNVFNKEMSKT